MIRVTDEITLKAGEIKLDFTRSQGPGGQNVNKVSTAAKLRFDVLHSSSLPEEVRRRLIALAGNRVTKDGILIIHAKRFRTQERNRQDAVLRLIKLIREAAVKPKARHRTRPGIGAKKRRMEEKRKRGRTKQMRRPVNQDE